MRDDWRSSRTRMLSLTGRGRKTADEMRIHFPGFHQCRGSELLRPNIMYTHNKNTYAHTLGGKMHMHTNTHTSPPNCSQWGFFFFFHTGPDTKSWNIKRCPNSVVWVSIIPALMALSLNHGEAANCQLLCPHYPRPPAQTGALGHCPRNHSAPVASQES